MDLRIHGLHSINLLWNWAEIVCKLEDCFPGCHSAGTSKLHSRTSCRSAWGGAQEATAATCTAIKIAGPSASLRENNHELMFCGVPESEEEADGEEDGGGARG